MDDKVYEVIIVGTGAAGLFAALSLPSDCNALMRKLRKVILI
jgi:L-aspartate oxidase